MTIFKATRLWLVPTRYPLGIIPRSDLGALGRGKASSLLLRAQRSKSVTSPAVALVATASARVPGPRPEDWCLAQSGDESTRGRGC